VSGAACVDAVVRITRITQSDRAHALAIPERTLTRRKREGALSPEEPAKLLHFARVVERAKTVFEEADSALKWLQGPNASLGGVTPPSLLDTLGRIEQGVFA
jgi:putative toxin-antitoxin system antitoxin component (TIGR02293 family)